MTHWTETYRGAVPPWQCDVTEHFTVAYYFDRLEEAEANIAEELGLGDLPGRGDLVRRVELRVRRSSPATSTPLVISLCRRSCFVFPMHPVRPEPRSGWITISCSSSGAAF